MANIKDRYRKLNEAMPEEYRQKHLERPPVSRERPPVSKDRNVVPEKPKKANEDKIKNIEKEVSLLEKVFNDFSSNYKGKKKSKDIEKISFQINRLKGLSGYDKMKKSQEGEDSVDNDYISKGTEEFISMYGDKLGVDKDEFNNISNKMLNKKRGV